MNDIFLSFFLITKGYYIYTHNTKWKRGAKAILNSPMLGPTTGKGNCFTFYYHMYGMQMGTLNIYTVTSGEKTLRWTKSGNQGSNWKYAHFNINSKFNYQVRPFFFIILRFSILGKNIRIMPIRSREIVS